MSEREARYFEDGDFEVPEKAPLQRVDPVETVIAKTALTNTVEHEEALLITNEDDKEPELIGVQLTDDPVRDYLRVIGRSPLLNAEQEVANSKSIEVGLFAGERKALLLEQGVPENALEIRELKELERIGERATNTMINSNLRLVVSIGKKYFDRGLAPLDIYQEGNMGLIRAVKKFDYTKGFKFSTYATWWIKQSITRAIADTSSEIRIPVHMHEKITKMKRLEQTADRAGHFLTDEQLAKDMDETLENIQKYREYAKIRRPFSYNTKMGDSQEDEYGEMIQDEAAIMPEDVAETNDLEKAMREVLDSLTDREARIITMRYGLGGQERRTLDAIAADENLTRERIRQIETKIIKKLQFLHSGKDHLREYLS